MPPTSTQQIKAGTGRKSPYPLNFPGGNELVIPVHHERTSSVPPTGTKFESGFHSDTDTMLRRSPASLSLSGANRLRKRYSLPNTQNIEINIDRLHDNDTLLNRPHFLTGAGIVLAELIDR